MRPIQLLASVVALGAAHVPEGVPFPILHGPGESTEGSARGWGRVARAVAANLTEKGRRWPFAPQVIHTKVRTKDGAELTTVVVNPHPYGARKATVVCRSPYDFSSSDLARVFVLTNKYVAVMQDMRGTYASTGTFDMFRTASGDGLDTMAWIGAQPWSNGDVYSVGISADGMGEMVMVILKPPMLKGQWWAWATGNGHHLVYPHGMYQQDLIENYMRSMEGQTHGASVSRVIPEVRSHEAWSTWWYNITSCRIPSPCHYASVKFPVISTAGWWDIFSQPQLDDWAGIRAYSDASVRDTHVLIVSPLGHCLKDLHDDVFEHSGLTLNSVSAFLVSVELAAETFSGNLHGPVRARLGRINFYVMVGYGHPLARGFWASFDDWPAFKTRTLYLRGGGALSQLPAIEAGSVEYTYDPLDPTPMIGGSMIPGISKTQGHCGTSDQLTRENRSDVVVFDSDPLEEELPIVGRIRARLFVSSTAKDTDFVVTLSDLSPGLLGTSIGRRSMLVRNGALRMRWRDSDTVRSDPLQPEHVYEIEVDLATTAYILPKGHRVRVAVSSAASPFYNPNPNTGKLLIEDGTPVAARNTIYLSPKHPSSVMLPVVDRRDIPENRHFLRAAEPWQDVLV